MSFIRTNLLSAEILYFDWFWRLVKINEDIVKNELHPHFEVCSILHAYLLVFIDDRNIEKEN